MTELYIPRTEKEAHAALALGYKPIYCTCVLCKLIGKKWMVRDHVKEELNLF
ncbi:MAG: hypothetical protein AABX70_02280 [Nanoarchaeota archaeon]